MQGGRGPADTRLTRVGCLIGLILTASITVDPDQARSLAFAHTGLGHVVGFAEGVAHPLSGLDHVLAMVMVGVLAWQGGERAMWLLPASFLAVMALGAGLGMAGLGLPLVEAGIALSVIALGGAIAFGLRLPLAAGANT